MIKVDIKKYAALGVMTSLSLIIFIVEMQFPPLYPIPGLKAGFANIIALFMLYLGGRWRYRDVYTMHIARILLAAVFSPNFSVIIFSLFAGVTALSAMIVTKTLFKNMPMIFVSITGSVTHNMSQLLMAAIIMRGAALGIYIPILAAAGIVTGLLTGTAVSVLYSNCPGFINSLRKE